jgi:DNA-binding CsgD family transcriptional regulator
MGKDRDEDSEDSLAIEPALEAITRALQRVVENLESRLRLCSSTVSLKKDFRVAKIELEDSTYVLMRLSNLDTRGLSRRQREVARLLADGLSRKEIAARLGISQRTVDSHRERLYGKYHASSRAAIIRRITLLS